jgi:hypothetical protein
VEWPDEQSIVQGTQLGPKQRTRRDIAISIVSAVKCDLDTRYRRLQSHHGSDCRRLCDRTAATGRHRLGQDDVDVVATQVRAFRTSTPASPLRRNSSRLDAIVASNSRLLVQSDERCTTQLSVVNKVSSLNSLRRCARPCTEQAYILTCVLECTRCRCHCLSGAPSSALQRATCDCR